MRRTFTLSILILVASAWNASHTAQATPVFVTNYSFETPGEPAGSGAWSYGSNAVPGWQLAYTGDIFGNPQSGTTDGVQAYAPYQYPAIPNGNQALFVNYNGGLNGVSQDVGALTANTTYNLTVYVGERLDGLDGGYAGISLLNGTNYQGAPLAFGYLQPTSMIPGQFQPLTISYTSGAVVSGDLTIYLNQYLQSPSTGGNYSQVSFDNVILTATPVPSGATFTPEPGSAAILLAGLGAGMVLWRKARRTTAFHDRKNRMGLCNICRAVTT